MRDIMEPGGGDPFISPIDWRRIVNHPWTLVLTWIVCLVVLWKI